MKTILYQPLFINPQAYFVFPQLYNIEKADQYIEPAVYTGQLLIDVLTDNTFVTISDTNYLDFSEFAGKRIRISQYTDTGAVVLGEWLLPEDEMPGPSFHQSLVDAWFMSGYSNDNPPDSISGYKGHELVLKNFAFTSNSGFGGSVDHSGGNDEGKAASSYEGSLVFDGVDDYAVCDNIPIQTDYTVICRRQIWDKQNDNETVVASKSLSYDTGAFIFEFLKNSTKDQCRSFGTLSSILVEKSDSISYQTSTSYNGTNITKGTGTDTDILYLGNTRKNDNRYLYGAIYYFALYDKSLTPDEIEQEKIKLNEIWTKRLNG